MFNKSIGLLVCLAGVICTEGEARAADPVVQVGGGVVVKLGGATISPGSADGFALSLQPELDVRGFNEEGAGLGAFIALQGTGIVPSGTASDLTLSQGSALLGVSVFPMREVEWRADMGLTRVTANVSNQSLLLGTGYLLGVGMNVHVAGPFGIGVDYQYSGLTASPEVAAAAGQSALSIGQWSLALNLLW